MDQHFLQKIVYLVLLRIVNFLGYGRKDDDDAASFSSPGYHWGGRKKNEE